MKNDVVLPAEMLVLTIQKSTKMYPIVNQMRLRLSDCLDITRL